MPKDIRIDSTDDNLKNDLWKYYNTWEDISVSEVSHELLASIPPSDPKSQSYKKEDRIQNYMHVVKSYLSWLKFDYPEYEKFIENPPPIDIQYCKSRCKENTSRLYA